MKTIKTITILCLLSTVVPSVALSDKEAAAMLVSMDKCLEGSCKHEPNEHTQSRYDEEIKRILTGPDLTYYDLRLIERKCDSTTRDVYLDSLKSDNYYDSVACFNHEIWKRQKEYAASTQQEATNAARNAKEVQQRS